MEIQGLNFELAAVVLCRIILAARSDDHSPRP